MSDTFYILSDGDEILCAENGDRLIWAVSVPATVDGGGWRLHPPLGRVELRGAWAAPASTIAGALDVTIPVRAAWRAPQAVPVGSLDLRLTLDGQWRPNLSRTQARVIVANPGEHVVVVESEDDADCLVIVQ